jgi:hypothetical protein
MFYQRNSTSLIVNCAVIPNSDVSGVGVRVAFYVQAFVFIILSLDVDAKSIFLSNLSIQVTSAALIGSAYLDHTIDVPHTLVASQLAVLFSACRTTTYDLSESLPGRQSIKSMCQAWVLDMFFQTSLLFFNYSVWSNIIAIQNEPTVCPDGCGQWGIFSHAVDIHRKHPITTFVYTYCILDIMWECFRVVAHLVRAAVEPSLALDPFDPRFWFIRKAIKILGVDIANGCLARGSFVRKVLSFVRKVLSFVFVISSVETTLDVNGLVQEGENHWTFGQIFVMCSLFYPLSVLVSRYSLISTLWGWVRSDGLWAVAYANAFIIGIPLGVWVIPGVINATQDNGGLVYSVFLGWFIVLMCELIAYVIVALSWTFLLFILSVIEVIESLLGLPSIAESAYNFIEPVIRIYGYAFGLIEVPDYQRVTDESESI